jgi:hypothetical protein
MPTVHDYFHSNRSFNASAKLQLKNDVIASFATVTQQPSKYKITVLGVDYPLAYLNLVKLGYACKAMYEDIDIGCGE